MTVLGLIPARGGSKGVPRKNLAQVGGRTLIARAVAALKDSGVVDHVLVSTEDDEIAAEARRAGADVPFLRPPDLAGDDAPMTPVIHHAVETYQDARGVTVDTLVFTEPTLPFRNAGHVRQAVERFRRGDCKSVIAVCPLERKPENIFVKDAHGHLQRYIREPKITYTRRQDMDHLCRLSSGVYVVGWRDYLTNDSLVVAPVGYTEMTNRESINIDEELDLVLAQTIAERYAL